MSGDRPVPDRLGKDQKTLFGAATTGLFRPSSRKPEEFSVFA
jgi:hypothetical protein